MVKSSIYKADNVAIISVANWTGQSQITSVSIAWAQLGMDPASTDIFVPEIEGFQLEQKSISLDKITIPGKEGYLIVLKKRNK
jgi:hypothetical protein